MGHKHKKNGQVQDIITEEVGNASLKHDYK